MIQTAQKPTISDLVECLKLTRIHIWIIFSCLLGFLFDSLNTNIMSMAMPSIKAEWNIDAVVLGSIGSGALWGGVIGAFIWGPVSDLFGRKVALVGTIMGFSLVTGLCGFAQNTTQFFWLRFVTGLFLGGLIPIDLAYMSEFAPLKYRGILVTSLGVTWPLGSMLGAVMSLNLLPIFGWRILFFIGALPTLVGLMVILLVPESPRWLAKKGKFEKAVQIVKKLGASVLKVDDVDFSGEARTGNGHSFLMIVRGLFSANYRGRTIGAMAMQFFYQFCYYSWSVWLPTVLKTVFNLSLSQTFQLTILVYIGSFAGKSLIALTIDIFERRTWIRLSFGGMIVMALIIAYLFRSEAGVKAVVVCAFLYQILIDLAVVQVYIPELFPSEIRNTGASWALTIGRIASALGPMIFGYFMALKVYHFMFITIAMASFCVMSVTFFLTVETRGRSLSKVGSM